MCYSIGMKKWGWLIATSIAAIAVAVVIYWEAKACEAAANKCIASFAVSGKPNQAAPPNEAIHSCRESQGYLCRVVAPANLPNIGLFFIGLGAVWAALFTLGAVRSQTDALIRSERAWIMVELSPAPGSGEKVHALTGASIQHGIRTTHTGIPLRVICRNEGKVPAWITEKGVYVKILATSPPRKPEFKGSGENDYEPRPVSAEREALPHWDVTPICEGTEATGQITIVYGYVRYRDPFAEGHITTFGYRLTPDSKLVRLEGQDFSKYNENT